MAAAGTGQISHKLGAKLLNVYILQDVNHVVFGVCYDFIRIDLAVWALHSCSPPNVDLSRVPSQN